MTKKERFLKLVDTYCNACLATNRSLYKSDGSHETVGREEVMITVSQAIELNMKRLPFDPSNPHCMVDDVTNFCDWVMSGYNAEYKPEWITLKDVQVW